jgi:organic radical activating enzyme
MNIDQLKKELTVGDVLDIYDIRIMLQCSYKCNHMCWFCDEWDNKEGRSWSLDDCDLVVEKLEQLPEQYKNIYILMYGGEPTLCKHWEYLHFEIYKALKGRNVLIQTQSNMSINHNRLKSFTDNLTHQLQDNHSFDICGSYHLNKQQPQEFIDKMFTISEVALYGGVSYSGEIIKNTEQSISEYEYIQKNYKDDRIFFRTLAVNNRDVLSSKRYRDVIASNSTYKSAGPVIDFHYMYDNYRDYIQEYLPFGYNLPIINKKQTIWDNIYLSLTYKNMASTLRSFKHNRSLNLYQYLDENYIKAIEEYVLKGQIAGGSPKYMRCDSFQKGLVITHDLNVYSCLDNYYNNVRPIQLNELDLNKYTKRCHICMLHSCVSSDTHLRTPSILYNE